MLESMSVFQEQSLLLYAIAGLLILLNVFTLAVWWRLGFIEDKLRQRPPQQPTAQGPGLGQRILGIDDDRR